MNIYTLEISATRYLPIWPHHLYSLLKNKKDVTIYKIAMPVHLNEPPSFTLVLLATTFYSAALVLMDNNKGVYALDNK